MICCSSHKFAFSNLHFSPFYEHFSQLREKYAFKLKRKYIMLISPLSPIWWCKIHNTFSKKFHSTHSTYLFKIFFSLLTLSTAFLQKASGPVWVWSAHRLSWRRRDYAGLGMPSAVTIRFCSKCWLMFRREVLADVVGRDVASSTPSRQTYQREVST